MDEAYEKGDTLVPESDFEDQDDSCPSVDCLVERMDGYNLGKKEAAQKIADGLEKQLKMANKWGNISAGTWDFVIREIDKIRKGENE